MTTRTRPPVGAPCWVDLWTSDVEASRQFYSGLFDWKAEEPNPSYGGYFMFSRDGTPVAGGMGPMDDLKPTDTWSVYLCTDDVEATLQRVTAAGGTVAAPATPVDDLGVQAAIADPTGASVGLWQPKEFPGFTVLGEPGAPSWFELRTASYDEAVAFYGAVLGVSFVASGTDGVRYATLQSPEGGEADLAGIMDAGEALAPGAASWSVYWEVDDLEATLARLDELGGSLTRGPDDTAWGRLAEVRDRTGAPFRLRSRPGQSR